jgi:hypothetical protein
MVAAVEKLRVRSGSTPGSPVRKAVNSSLVVWYRSVRSFAIARSTMAESWAGIAAFSRCTDSGSVCNTL